MKSRFARILIIFLSVLFLVHLTAGVYVALNHTEFFLHDDGGEYLDLAKSFARDGTFTASEGRYYEAPAPNPKPESLRALLLPLIGGIFIFIFRNPLVAVAIQQALTAVLFAYVLYRIGKNFRDSEQDAWLVMLVGVFHPLLFLFSIRFSSELLFTTLLALFFLFSQRPFRGQFVCMGLAAGLASQVRPTAMLLLPACLFYFLLQFVFARFFSETIALKRYLTRSVVFTALFLVCIVPLGIRNYNCFGTFNSTMFGGGFSFLVGNCRENLNAYRASTGKEFLYHQNQGWDRSIAFAAAMPPGLPPQEQDKRFREEAYGDLSRMSFTEKCTLYGGKAWHFIRPWPLYGAHGGMVFWGIALSEILLFAFGLTGLFLFRKHRSELLFMAMIVCTGWTAHTFVHLQLRHRIPFLDLCMIILAGYALSEFVRYFQKKRSESRDLAHASQPVGQAQAESGLPCTCTRENKP